MPPAGNQSHKIYNGFARLFRHVKMTWRLVVGTSERRSHETSPSQILASGSGHCRAASLFALRAGASLSDAPITIIVAAAAGGTTDEWLLLGQWGWARWDRRTILCWYTTLYGQAGYGGQFNNGNCGTLDRYWFLRGVVRHFITRTGWSTARCLSRTAKAKDWIRLNSG